MTTTNVERNSRGVFAMPGEGAVAVAYPNMALVKYWGKRDEQLVLPVTSSLSMTLDICPTTTSVRLTGAPTDSVILNDCAASGSTLARVTRFLELVRQRAGRREHAEVISANTVPTGAGLASSSAGFAALAVAAAGAYGLRLDTRALSRLARRGSGSACRSVIDGLAIWHAGTGLGEEGDATSYAEPIEGSALDMAMVLAIVDTEPKALSSRKAMRRTVGTSPLYRAWARESVRDLQQMRKAIGQGDIDAVGQIAEHNAFGMHATMLAAVPAIRYLAPASIAVLDRVLALRADGVAAYATVDAGPNVAVLCASGAAPYVAAAVREVGADVSTMVAGPGLGAALVTGGVS